MLCYFLLSHRNICPSEVLLLIDAVKYDPKILSSTQRPVPLILSVALILHSLLLMEDLFWFFFHFNQQTRRMHLVHKDHDDILL